MVKNDNSCKDCACYHILREHNRESCDATKDIIVPPELKPLVNMFFSWGTGAKFKSFFTMLWEAQVRMRILIWPLEVPFFLVRKWPLLPKVPIFETKLYFNFVDFQAFFRPFSFVNRVQFSNADAGA